MRLTIFQQTTISENARRYFGESTRVWLFGSRVDDAEKGGDIDLYIEPENQEMAALALAKLHFLRALHSTLGEQKIDVVLRPADAKILPIYQIAKKTGIQLQ
ncbi:MAG: nucleotidyltransferase domain-containing protein [Methylococcaceae bacterium]